MLRLSFVANAALSVARVVTYNGSDFRSLSSDSPGRWAEQTNCGHDGLCDMTPAAHPCLHNSFVTLQLTPYLEPLSPLPQDPGKISHHLRSSGYRWNAFSDGARVTVSQLGSLLLPKQTPAPTCSTCVCVFKRWQSHLWSNQYRSLCSLMLIRSLHGYWEASCDQLLNSVAK